MKKIILLESVIIASTVILCFCLNYVEASEITLNNDNRYLSVRESLIPMFARGNFSGPYSDEQFPLDRINPKTKEYIHFYLENDNSNTMNIYGGIWLLGFIGDENDILSIEQYVDHSLKRTSEDYGNRIRHLRNLAGITGYFTGMMIKRNVEGSKTILKKYSKVSAWLDPNEGQTPDNIKNAKDFYSYFIMSVYQYSKSQDIYKLLQEKSSGPNPYLHESFLDSLKSIQVDKYTELMKPVSISEKKLNENMEKCLEKYGEQIDLLMSKQTLADWIKQQEDQEKATLAQHEEKPTKSLESIDLSNTVEGANIKAIAVDSVKAYLRMPKTGNVESTLIQKEFLQELLKAGLKNFANFHVKAELEATINNFVPSININERNNETTALKPNIVRDKVNANVTFDIKGTSDMLKKYGPDAVHISLLSPKTGDFVVNMIRMNENWIWTPVVNSPISIDSNIVDDKYLVNSVNKAMIAYSEITKRIIDGNYDYLTIPVINNYKLIPMEKRKKDKDEMTNALDIEKKVLEDLARDNLNNYSDYQVKITFEATLDNGVLNVETGTMPKEIKGYETADLTFIIRNGGKAFMAHTTSRNDRSCIDSAGNLKVNMKRINGTWYWNPFGW